MNDESHVSLVDAHAEGVGTDYDSHHAVLPQLLAGVLIGVLKTGVVVDGADAVVVEDLGELGGLFAIACIDDGGALGMLQDLK